MICLICYRKLLCDLYTNIQRRSLFFALIFFYALIKQQKQTKTLLNSQIRKISLYLFVQPTYKLGNIVSKDPQGPRTGCQFPNNTMLLGEILN